MFPTKSDFVELQRLLPRPERNFPVEYAELHRSPLFTVNRSSSSTDSASPESYFENSFIYSVNHLESDHTSKRLFNNSVYFEPVNYVNDLRSTQSIHRPSFESEYQQRFEFRDQRLSFDTPSGIRQRPILGRKIIPQEPKIIPENIWSCERKYELFPMENQVDELDISSPKISLSPFSGMNPGSIGYLPKISPITNPINFEQPGSSSGVSSPKVCKFCKKNGERPKVYGSHCVKEKIGNKYVVTCPVLRLHVCAICGASGDDAHTITYCPVVRTTNNGKPVPSTTLKLKNTRIKSNGKKRFS